MGTQIRVPAGESVEVAILRTDAVTVKYGAGIATVTEQMGHTPSLVSGRAGNDHVVTGFGQDGEPVAVAEKFVDFFGLVEDQILEIGHGQASG